MKTLWLINTPLPEAAELLDIKAGNSGGWLIGASDYLASNLNVKLSVLFPMGGRRKSPRKAIGSKIDYFTFPQFKNKRISHNEKCDLFEQIIKEVEPDIVHIFGTELPHSLIMLNVCNKLGVKSVISIQGLVSKIENHITSDLPYKVVYGFTLRNLILKDRVIDLRTLYKNLGENEIETFKRAKHVIGRTTFDKACAQQVNNGLYYHHCNESLRKSFYDFGWNINNCEKYSIFLSQAHYPIKGIHYMIEALPLILERFPQTRVYVGGKNITKSKKLKDKFLMTYYGKYIKKLIKQRGLDDKIIFVGPLDESKMCRRYLDSHVFVCPSSIENSPNSLAEAMILGVPSVASYVGGVPDMMKHSEEGFIYPADAPYMLAHNIMRVFEDDNLAMKFSINAKTRAKKTHSREENGKKLMDIYSSIIDTD